MGRFGNANHRIDQIQSASQVFRSYAAIVADEILQANGNAEAVRRFQRKSHRSSFQMRSEFVRFLSFGCRIVDEINVFRLCFTGGQCTRSVHCQVLVECW